MTRKEFVAVAIATLITVMAWMIFDIIHARSKVEISPKVKEFTEPINPQFDLEVLNE